MHVRVSPAAYRDLARLADFLAPKSIHAADLAADALIAAIRSLTEFPERGRAVRENLRELRVAFGRDGYLVRYRVGPAEVLVTRIWHGRELR